MYWSKTFRVLKLLVCLTILIFHILLTVPRRLGLFFASEIWIHYLICSWQLTLLATDKTGTLTRNQMTVSNIWSGEKMYSAFQVSIVTHFTPLIVLIGFFLIV